MTVHPAIAAGVAVTEEDVAEFDRAAAAAGVVVGDIVTAIARTDLMTLDNMGLRVRFPEAPEPEPDASVVTRLERAYGVGSEDQDADLDQQRRDAAWRSTVAIERRRQGWTRQQAMAEFTEAVFVAIQEANK